MKLYLKMLLIISVLLVVLGIGCPYLISSKHNELVFIGYVLLAALPVAIFYIWRFGNKPKTEKVK